MGNGNGRCLEKIKDGMDGNEDARKLNKVKLVMTRTELNLLLERMKEKNMKMKSVSAVREMLSEIEKGRERRVRTKEKDGNNGWKSSLYSIVEDHEV